MEEVAGAGDRDNAGGLAVDRCGARVDYYFGDIDERRVTWSRGRDVPLSLKQDGGPVNSVAKAYVEVDGVSIADGKGWTRKLTFTEKS